MNKTLVARLIKLSPWNHSADKSNMYRVRYYMSGGTRVSRLFNTLHDATMFAVYSICAWDVYDFIKVKDERAMD